MQFFYRRRRRRRIPTSKTRYSFSKTEFPVKISSYSIYFTSRSDFLFYCTLLLWFLRFLLLLYSMWSNIAKNMNRIKIWIGQIKKLEKELSWSPVSH